MKKYIYVVANFIFAAGVFSVLAMGGPTPSFQVAPGTVIAFAGATCPAGTIAADGTSYLRTTYANLYSAIGSANGTADGTHFNVPDYRGRFIRGTDGSTARDPDAAGRTAMNTGGNTGDNVGSVETSAFASHSHAFQMAGNSSASSNTTRVAGASGGSDITLTGFVTNDTGASSETRPINAYVKYCIKY